MMGAEIALAFAMEGFDTILNSRKQENADKGVAKMDKALSKKVAKGKMTEEKKAEILGNVTATADFNALADCDFVVEAVLEDVELKKSIFQKLDDLCKPEAILASNTSSISISKLASAVKEERKPKFIGAHFNSPASVMKLVEVVPGLLTAEETVEEVIDALNRAAKEPVKVKDVVGFGLNRIFHCMYLEAMRLIEEGVCSPEDVDKICKYGLGHPMGICSLLDILSHDLNQSVDEILFAEYGDRFRPSPVIRRMVDSGRLGRKTGAGFFEYDK